MVHWWVLVHSGHDIITKVVWHTPQEASVVFFWSSLEQVSKEEIGLAMQTSCGRRYEHKVTDPKRFDKKMVRSLQVEEAVSACDPTWEFSNKDYLTETTVPRTWYYGTPLVISFCQITCLSY